MDAKTEAAINRKFNLKRSPEWPRVEKDFLSKNHVCAACGSRQKLNAHHMFPFHFVVLSGRPDLELDERNLITLCTNQNFEHHLLVGHLDDYESYNPKVKKFVKTYHGKDAGTIRADRAWQKAHVDRKPHYDKMTPQEKISFRRLLDKTFPINKALAVKEAHARRGLKFTIPGE